MKRLGKATAAAGLAAALALTGCSGQKLEGGDKGGSGTITLKVAFWGDMGLDKLKAEYEAAHPNIKIVLNSGEYNAQHEDLQKKLVAGTGAPDISAVDEGFIVQFRSQADKFVNFMDKGGADFQSKYLPWKWQGSMSPDGKQIGLGTDVGGLAMCYRTDLFVKAGLPTDRVFLDPVLRGRYPDDVLADLARVTDLGHIRDGDLTTVAVPLSLLGINYYSRYVVAAGPDPVERSPWPGSETVRFVTRDGPVTAMDWAVDPRGLTETLCRLAREYPLVPFYVTENGAAYHDELGPDGAVDDPDRVAYVDGHLHACLDAISAGVPLQGYFAWSLLDNFEWSWGYGRRFGLVYVDYATQRRIIKLSGHRYREVIERGAL
jgi:Glycosyl hydrolase family 1/Bacterial extracellular solute-binding protein